MTGGPMDLRSLAREVAFQMLYCDDLNPQDMPQHEEVQTQEVVEFARKSLHALLHEDPDPADRPQPHRTCEGGLATADSLQKWLDSPILIEMTRSLVAGVRGSRAELDRRLAQAAEHWSIARMPPTDRNLLRLGAFEIIYAQTPDKAAIDEAIELAKRFGTADSPAFVNGILDRLMNQ